MCLQFVVTFYRFEVQAQEGKQISYLDPSKHTYIQGGEETIKRFKFSAMPTSL
jgi:hypothetical protein